jgi:hypothetical protein
MMGYGRWAINLAMASRQSFIHPFKLSSIQFLTLSNNYNKLKIS